MVPTSKKTSHPNDLACAEAGRRFLEHLANIGAADFDASSGWIAAALFEPQPCPMNSVGFFDIRFSGIWHVVLPMVFVDSPYRVQVSRVVLVHR